MPVIYLVRHGQASFGGEDYDLLSPLGAEQAALVGGELRRRGADEIVVVCGTLRRQQKTAQLLLDAGEFDAEVGVDPRWNEYVHADLPSPSPRVNAHEYQATLEAALVQWVDRNASDGWRGFQSDAVTALEELGDRLEPGQVGVAVTSGGTISAVVSHIWQLSTEGTLRTHRVIANGSLTGIILGRQGMHLSSVNDHAHLLGEDGMLTYR